MSFNYVLRVSKIFLMGTEKEEDIALLLPIFLCLAPEIACCPNILKAVYALTGTENANNYS